MHQQPGGPVDLILFAGQSNMAGRGVTSERWPETAPDVTDLPAWEFRAVTDPTRLHPIAEPFGVLENRADGINDLLGGRPGKTGSMVSAFVEAYCGERGAGMVAVSAAKGGSAMAEWQPGGPFLTDALSRLDAARTWLTGQGIAVRRIFCVWCQGETDGDRGTAPEDYRAQMDCLLTAMTDAGVEKLLMVRIGQCNIPGAEDRYRPIIAAQDALAAADDRVVMVSTCLAGMRARGLMKDAFHYFQQAYNEAGREAGRHAARWARD